MSPEKIVFKPKLNKRFYSFHILSIYFHFDRILEQKKNKEFFFSVEILGFGFIPICHKRMLNFSSLCEYYLDQFIYNKLFIYLNGNMHKCLYS